MTSAKCYGKLSTIARCVERLIELKVKVSVINGFLRNAAEVIQRKLKGGIWV
jgi:hypothetical protein